MDWLSIKTELTGTVGLSRDAVHILSGLGIQFALVLATRSWFGRIWPVVIVLIAALANEYWDLTSEIWPDVDRGRQWAESAKDMVTTLLAPTLIMLLARIAPARFTRPSQAPAADAGEGAVPPDPL